MTNNVQFSCTKVSNITNRNSIKILKIDKTIDNIRSRMLNFEIIY